MGTGGRRDQDISPEVAPARLPDYNRMLSRPLASYFESEIEIVGEMAPDSFERLQSDLQSHAKTLSVLIEDQRDMKDAIAQMLTDKAVRVVEDRNLNDRLGRIEKSILSLQSIGKWILAAFGTVFVAAIANFIIGGHLAP